MATLAQNIQRAINDFNSIENAIVQKGVPVPDGTPTSEYAALIGKLPGIIETANWTEVQRIVQAGNGPISFPVGTQMKVNHSVFGEHLYDVVAHDYLKKFGDETAHTMTLLCHDALNSFQFCPSQAFYYAEQELPAGTYNFTIGGTYGQWLAGTYQFALLSPVPAGGQLGLSGNPVASITTQSVRSYASARDTAYIESVAVTEGSAGTNLGTFGTELNHIQRVSYGSNNYKESPIRQLLNSNGAAGTFWAPQTMFDRPPGWNASAAGFVQGLDPVFNNVVCEVVLPCSANDTYEAPDSTVAKGSSYTLNDKYYFASRTEIYGSSDDVTDGTYQFPFFRGTTDVDKMRYRNDAAQHWWLRTPTRWDASLVRVVNPSGALYFSAALINDALVPACTIG